MRKDIITLKPIYSSFFSCGKDMQLILKTLFVSSKPYSDFLKRLLVINNKDCLDISNQNYTTVINNLSLKDLIDKGYIRKSPKVTRTAHQEIKTYIIISFDNFSPNIISSDYRSYNISFDIVCHNDVWSLDDYQNRPLLICGYIDGILNSLTADNTFEKSHKDQIKLSGVGQYEFLSCNEVVLNEDFSMYSLLYRGMMFTQDMQKLGVIHEK